MLPIKIVRWGKKNLWNYADTFHSWKWFQEFNFQEYMNLKGLTIFLTKIWIISLQYQCNFACFIFIISDILWATKLRSDSAAETPTNRREWNPVEIQQKLAKTSAKYYCWQKHPVGMSVLRSQQRTSPQVAHMILFQHTCVFVIVAKQHSQFS